MKKCLKCGELGAKYEDPEQPPITIGICICGHCRKEALEDMIFDLENELYSLRHMVKALKIECDTE